MNYINTVVPLITDPVNLDAVIQKIQIRLAELVWLEQAYGRATTGYVVRDGKPYRQPEVYVGDGNYMILEPNNYLASHAFFKTDGPIEIKEYRPFVNNFHRQRVSIIFWGNLARITELNPELVYEHRYTEELKADAVNLLRHNFGDFEIQRVYDTPETVYAGYTYDHTVNQTFKHPEFGFRIEGVINYLENCTANVPPAGGRIIVNGGFLKY